MSSRKLNKEYFHWLKDRRRFRQRRRSWFGVPISKYPTDLMAYQQLIVEAKPNLIIECGTESGGSALFFAHLFDLMDGHANDGLEGGEIITIDIREKSNRPQHPRITYLTGGSTNAAIVAEVARRAEGRRVMVALDSDHHYDHVRKELEIYPYFVSTGQYLVVEDTFVDYWDIRADYLNNGPYRAVTEFMAEHGDEFEQIGLWDERAGLTCNPGGWLRRKEIHAAEHHSI